MALSYNLGYHESISVHPTRRQIFAGKPYSTFPNIWQRLISSFPRMTTSQLALGELTRPRKAVELWLLWCYFLISKIDNATTFGWGSYQAEEVKGHLGEQPERQLQQKSWERYFIWLSTNKHGTTKAMKQTSLWRCVWGGRSGWIKHCKKKDELTLPQRQELIAKHVRRF